MERRDVLKALGLGSVATILGTEVGKSEKAPVVAKIAGKPMAGAISSDALTITVNGKVYHVLMTPADE